MKAIIIGAGVGGLATAVALKQMGVAVRVYEQASAPRELGAGLSLWANARHALGVLGLGEAVWGDDAAEYEGGSIYTDSGEILTSVPVGAMRERYGAATLIVDRGALLRRLAEAAGDVVSYGRRFARYEQTAAAVTAYFDDNTFDTAPLLIGADGVHSAVRGQLRPRSGAVYSGYAAWRSIAPLPPERVAGRYGEYWGPGRRFGLLPLGGGRAYWFAVENRAQNTPPDNHHAHLTEYFGGWATPIPEVLAATPPDTILYNDVTDLETLPSWTNGRVTLLGDAAHAMTPNLGQGACQALEDAVVLARAITDGRDLAAGLAAYEQARRPHTRRVMRRARQVGAVGQWSNPAAVATRNAGMRLTPAAASLRALDEIIGHRV